jgi:hypothetical protein
VSEKAADLTGQVKKIADAALDEAKNQGITPKTVSQTLRAVGSKISPEQSEPVQCPEGNHRERPDSANNDYYGVGPRGPYV